jgi:hypothetical protein
MVWSVDFALSALEARDRDWAAIRKVGLKGNEIDRSIVSAFECR